MVQVRLLELESARVVLREVESKRRGRGQKVRKSTGDYRTVLECAQESAVTMQGECGPAENVHCDVLDHQ